jgi:predicted AAA+ superfamily ATPase
MHLPRPRDEERLLRLLRTHPVVGILGPRQVGKTSLARAVVRRHRGPVTLLDLEDPADLARLADARLTLEPLRGLVVIDEIQRRPDLFPLLRVLADRPRRPARFLVLGSASPDLLRQSAESLAGRVAYHELGGFSLEDVGPRRADRLWFRGGFPRSFLARTEREGDEWRRAFVRTFVERDLPQLGITIPGATLERFWAMLAHYHGQVWNASEFSRSFGVSDASVRRYVDLLAATFAVRTLLPWSENLGKRQVRSPKVYLADCGILHALLGIRERRDLERHPKLGASWESFALEAVVRRLGVEWRECHFWATHGGAELDLLVVRGRRRWGFEFKRTSAPAVTRSMRVALQDLRLERLDVVHGGPHSFALAPRMRAVAFSRLLDDIPPLR